MNKKLIIKISMISIALIAIVLGTSYAIWQTTKTQNTNNLVKSGCFNLELTGEANTITLDKAYPVTDEEGMRLTPYTFKIENTCTTNAAYNINLETLASSSLDSKYIKVSISDEEPVILNELETNVCPILSDAKDSKILKTGIVDAGKTKEFSLRLWLDEKVTNSSEVMGKTFASNITISSFATIERDSALLKENAFASLDDFKATATKIMPYVGTPSSDILASAKVISDDSSKNKAYAWMEDTTLYYYSDASTINMQNDRFGESGYYEKDGYSNIVSIDFANFDTSLVTNMSNMFYGCGNLTTLDLSGFDTSNVTTMEDMFDWCSGLTSLDLSNFNTSKVANMSYMFSDCSSLTTLDLSGFNTSNVTTMKGMFYNCSSLTTLDLNNFNTSNVKSMREMFNRCSGLTTLDLSNFNTSNVTIMYEMFRGCSSLITLDLSSFNTSNVTNMEGMFKECSNLPTLDLSNFNTSNVTNMDRMFYGCSSLTSLNLSSFNTSNVTDMSCMFQSCSNLTALDLSGFNTSNVTDMINMFYRCSSLTTLDLSGFNTSKVEYMGSMFSSCSNLTTIKLDCVKAANLKTNIESNYSSIAITCI